MKPHVLLIEPMAPETDATYCVHRLFAAHDRAALGNRPHVLAI